MSDEGKRMPVPDVPPGTGEPPQVIDPGVRAPAPPAAPTPAPPRKPRKRRPPFVL